MPATAPRSPRVERGRIIARWVLAAAYLFVGCVHLAKPGIFLPIMPHWVPFPHATILLTGVCELAGAVALLNARWRRRAGILLAAYAVCVYPANIQHAINDLTHGTGLGLAYHAPRLALQPLIVWWALFAGQVTGWPFARYSPASSR